MLKKAWTLSCVLLGLYGQSVSADIIYDAISRSRTGFAPQLNRSRMADVVSTTPVNHQPWVLEQLGLRVIAVNPGVYQDVTARIRIWDDWTPSDPVFSRLLSDVTWNLGTITNAGNRPLASNHAFDYAALGTPVFFDDSVTGFDIELLVNGVADNRLTMGVSSFFAPLSGTTALDGFYLDRGNDGVWSSSDFQDLPFGNTNLMLSLQAVPLPEPAVTGLACLAAWGLLRRRPGRAPLHLRTE